VARRRPRKASWGRVFGESTRQRLRGDADPQFDGRISGLQLGHDFLMATDGSGGRHRVGVLGGYTRASGDTSGVAERRHQHRHRPPERRGLQPRRLLDPRGQQRLVQRRRAHGHALQGRRALHARPRRHTARQHVTASLEAGYPLALGDNVTLQPQVQLIWQRSSVDDFDDGISAVRFQRDNAVTGRLGARLEGSFSAGGGTWKPYLKANLWHTFSGSNAIFFGPTDQVGNRRNASALEVGAGVVGQVNKTVAVYGGLAYTRAIGNAPSRPVCRGNWGCGCAGSRAPGGLGGCFDQLIWFGWHVLRACTWSRVIAELTFFDRWII
jgi:type V secretory pathway adhesin AidA